MTHRGTILWRCLINLAERYYPGAKNLGRPAKLATGSGTPEEALAALPTAERSGASMLHLGCHARAGGSSASTRLDLAGQPLSVTRILCQAHNRAAEAPGGLVVLAACTSDLTDRDHDEVLTLATTFLAAGAASVVGSRWEVDDARTALLMVMFHHFLDGGETPPTDALRAAQLWMLDPARVVPPAFRRVMLVWGGCCQQDAGGQAVAAVLDHWKLLAVMPSGSSRRPSPPPARPRSMAAAARRSGRHSHAPTDRRCG